MLSCIWYWVFPVSLARIESVSELPCFLRAPILDLTSVLACLALDSDDWSMHQGNVRQVGRELT